MYATNAAVCIAEWVAAMSDLDIKAHARAHVKELTARTTELVGEVIAKGMLGVLEEAIAMKVRIDELESALAQRAASQPDAFKEAYMEWSRKTDWVQEQLKSFPFQTLGLHRADVMTHEIQRLRAIVASQTDSERDAARWRAYRMSAAAAMTGLHSEALDAAVDKLVAAMSAQQGEKD